MTPPQYDAVVIGSGFGGSVTAYELARAGMRVCLLERGRKYPPGSFARSPYEMSRNFWDPSLGYYGLFDVWSFRHSEALVSSGLGGGSLIYANVLLRKPPRWFEEVAADGSRRAWPISRDDLEPHYDAVEDVLGGTRYPLEHQPYASTPKTVAFREAARRGNITWEPLNLAVTFASSRGATPSPGVPLDEPPDNLHGAPRETCRLCGECDIGCNYGSKNTLDYNYLSMAARAGAEIRHLHEVRSLKPSPEGGYEIGYVAHDPQRWEGVPRSTHDQRHLAPSTIRAKRVILAGGTLGSTYLLKKNRSHLPGLSRMLGERYSTNGDLLSFALKCKDSEGRPRIIDPSRGPVITGAATAMCGVDGDECKGGYIQDAGYPQFINWVAETTQLGGWFGRAMRFVWNRALEILSGRPQSDIDVELSKLLGSSRLSSGSVPLLGMGRDSATGRLTLSKDRKGREFLDVSWSRRDSEACFRQLTDLSRKLAEGMGGCFVENPTTRWLKRIITVHPLGGCPMGRTKDDGVVDPFGEVYGWPGLYVVDGAAMPGATGSNPSLTIAAFARRCAKRMLEGDSQGRPNHAS